MVEVEKKRKLKYNYIVILLALVIVIIIIFIFGKQIGKPIETEEESVGSGFVEVKTSPSDAEIYIDDEYKGVSPATIYNVPIGPRNILIKKEGYQQFQDIINIESGKKTFLEADLVLILTIEEEPDIIEETGEIVKVQEEETIVEEDLTQKNTIDIGLKILQYYDFSKGEFTPYKQLETDVFSKRYSTYFDFIRYSPANIKVIDKNINEVEKEDCIGIQGAIELLHSGKSLCIRTRENQILVLGGEWETTENAQLEWKELD